MIQRFAKLLKEDADSATEAKMFAMWIAVTGGLAALVYLAPPIMGLGLVLGVAPGVALWLAPTAFMYLVIGGAIYALARAGLRRTGLGLGPSRAVAGSAAFAAAVAIGFGVPGTFNPPGDKVETLLRSGDLNRSEPLEAPDAIALMIEGGDRACGTLCLRFLLNGAVERVIVPQMTLGGSPLSPVAYSIRRAGPCDAALLSTKEIVWPGDRPGDRVLARTRSRMAVGECVTASDVELSEAKMTIRYAAVGPRHPSYLPPEWTLPTDAVSAYRLEVLDAAGGTLFRRTETQTWPLAAPLRIASASGLMTSVTLFGWSRGLETRNEIGFEGRDVLPWLFGPAVKLPEL